MLKQGTLHTALFQPLAVLMLLVIMCTASCVWDKGELPVPVTSEQCDTATYTFTNEIGMIFVTNCAVSSCHEGSMPEAGLDFSAHAVVKEKVDDGRIQARVMDGPSFMPPAGKLPDSILAKINVWISEGMCE